MPVRYAITNGDWNNVNTWNDGSTLGIPTTGDDVWANNFTVNVNQNITVNSLNNTAITAQNTRLNPVMTSNTAPSGVATASSTSGASFQAWNAFDNVTGNSWQSNAAAPQWVQYQFTSSLIIRSYSIWYGSTVSGRPVNFNLQGSNDGITFTTLDTRTGFVFTNGQYNTLTITNATSSFSYYRLNVTAVDSGNPSVVELTFNEAGISTTAGGSFNFNTAGVVANVTSSTASLGVGAANLITISATTGSISLLLGGNVSSSSLSILKNGNCNFALTGANFSALSGSQQLISCTSLGTFTINGNLFGGTQSGGTSPCLTQTQGNLILNGNAIGGGNNTTNYAINFSGASLTVNGNTNGGILAAAILTSASSNTITGIVTASNVAAIISTSANTINVVGDVYASGTANGISSTNASGIVNLTGNMYNGLGRQAIYCQNIFISNTATTLWRMDTGGGNYKFLYSADSTPNLPSVSNVRSGTTFGPALSLTGTMVVASAANTRIGVATDNTVGTGELTSADIISGINASSDPLAVRMKNILTDVTAGNIISQYNNS